MIFRISTSDTKSLDTVKKIYEQGGVVVLPTDSVYVFTCSVKHASGLERISRIQGIDLKSAKFSMIFSDFSMMADYVRPFNSYQFKILKKSLPGPFTFIVEATPKIGKLIPMNRKTIGVRIPHHSDAIEIIRHLGHPVFSSSVYDPEDEVADYLSDPAKIHQVYGDKVDAVVDGGFGNLYPTTVVELRKDSMDVLREGLGDVNVINQID